LGNEQRDIQDEIYRLRKSIVKVPDWYYKANKDMQEKLTEQSIKMILDTREG
jgi:hypothetical protein